MLRASVESPRKGRVMNYLIAFVAFAWIVLLGRGTND